MRKIVLALLAMSAAFATSARDLPTEIDTGLWKAGHIQGIAVDAKKEFIYYSFTTVLVKADLRGNVVGTVTGLVGHLGCIELNEADGRIYGSLEYKDDEIGRTIIEREKVKQKLEVAFYVAIFDVEKIDRIGMDAEKDGIMTTVYIPTVLEDYYTMVKVSKDRTIQKKYGCSGFDGLSFGPKFGQKEGKRYLTYAYGIYKDESREDNDYQVLLQYDTTDWKKYETPLSQFNMHHNGPAAPDAKYFVYTGNTKWGVQNLEYDAETGYWFMASYPGAKPKFANYTLFVVDGNVAPRMEKLRNVPYEKKKQPVLTLAKIGKHDVANDVYGWYFKYPQTGICALGDGLFYISHKQKKTENKEHWGKIKLYRFVGTEEAPFERVK